MCAARIHRVLSGERAMPRYVIERSLPAGLDIPPNEVGASVCRAMVHNNTDFGVTWITSYTTPDRKHTFCIYDAPSPEAIRRAGDCNQLPVARVTEVRVLDPYFFK
jgi:hypothetical protein